MPTLSENISPKKNPVTFVLGIAVLGIGIFMMYLKYIAPSFHNLKQEPKYEGWQVLIVLLVGLILFFMNDNYFSRIFGVVYSYASKKTTETTDGKVTEEIKIEKKP